MLDDIMDIDLELGRILLKYEIFKEEPSLRDMYQDMLCTVLLNEMIEKIPADKHIALCGAGREAREFLKRLSKANRERISFAIDVIHTAALQGLTTILPDEMESKGIDTVILASHKNSMVFKGDMLSRLSAEAVIDPYDTLAQAGVFFRKHFYEDLPRPFPHIIYFDVNNAIQYYQQTNGNEKAFFLRRVIAYCLEIRDFISAFSYMQVYCMADYPNSCRYRDFQQELENLLLRIKRISFKRQKRDIQVDWVDNVPASEFYATEFAQELRNRATFFTNAYTVAPWTHLTHNAIFLQQMPNEGKIHLCKSLTQEDSPLLRMLNEHGMVFRYIANPGMYQKMFAPEQVATFPVDFEDKRVYRATAECSTRLQWKALRDRLLSAKPILCWVHDLAELHQDYAFVGKDKMFGNENEIYHSQGLAYLTKQLLWYSQFETQNM